MLCGRTVVKKPRTVTVGRYDRRRGAMIIFDMEYLQLIWWPELPATLTVAYISMVC
jgi:hypothetical protein